MRSLVVYESMFGNTRAVAEAVAEGLGDDVRIVEVGDAPTEVGADVDLLVIGAPTHAFGLSRPSTRDDAAQRAHKAGTRFLSRSDGVREWLERVRVTAPVGLAVFDTKVDKPRLPGSAAKKVAKQLRGAPVEPVAAPRHFLVADALGPLIDGELDRAREWGSRLPGRVRAS
ncbi:flavodoxin family protein [Saccharomonospora xinjiangensis]|uniref:Flavodoxin n=1 Tax=Saccharomonospora xinjiangensis XJ-54 TaxID=882086 RepID=I0UX19_9PSEU|nr:flavodoxin domain-containing protein [Saccharomonospora xinjiangensis]EID52422.1 flavodoxin [Saccharomonospora xinjiangensis XJ-54]